MSRSPRLSRDMRDLRVARVPTPSGIRYTMGDSASADENRATLASLVPQLFQRLDYVRELIVVKTVVAGAQPISEAIDSEGNPDVLGTDRRRKHHPHHLPLGHRAGACGEASAASGEEVTAAPSRDARLADRRTHLTLSRSTLARA